MRPLNLVGKKGFSLKHLKRVLQCRVLCSFFSLKSALKRRSLRRVCRTTSVRLSAVPYSFMPLCVSTTMCVHIHQNASKCVVPSMNHRDLSLAGGGAGGEGGGVGSGGCPCRDRRLILSCFCPPPTLPPPPAENVQLRRLRPVKPLPPRGRRRLGKQRESSAAL